MARKRFTINFKGFDDVLDRYQTLGGNTKQIIDKCLKVVPEVINPELKKDVAPHRRKKSGSAVDSLVENPNVEWEGTVGRIPVGFQFDKGGLTTIFLMYGTAKHAPSNQYGTFKGVTYTPQDKKLYVDIYGNFVKLSIEKKQREIFKQEIEKIMNKG